MIELPPNDPPAKCPKCGGNVEKPVKTWAVVPKGRGRPSFVSGLFACKCGRRFVAKA